ncbi:hypothetical protein [Janthinobacterium sp. NKUCC06_STL]|uniref:hypothetical protein n=1 Tax=Janthinobacterium sp. NKUCC06_STL TaxID=2842127 RepID=UPI001C5B456B|nr:hypothetical protein [Janthinobacterium sp. NKUCC06_STL]MBW3512924.1 hypothetical protein [Janthinobacterium sp. NKUCC06_STL]
MFQYNEDVKALARQAGLKIIDANVPVDRSHAAAEVPEVTIKSEYIDLGAGERMPTVAELTAARTDLLAAHDDLQQRERERELAAEKDRVAEQARENGIAAIRIADQTAANEAEAQRLRGEAGSLASGAVASTQATGMSKEQLQGALDSKGIKYPAAANKAELQALLGA